MGLFKDDEIRRIKTSEISGAVPGLEPRKDEVLLYLMEKAMLGFVPLYFGAVPFEAIVPFDRDYHPEKHPIGKQAIDQRFQEWAKGKIQPVLLYERGDSFILSDDYITYFAAVRGQPIFLPAWILGKPEHPRVEQLQGPIVVDEVAKIFFGT